VTWKGTVFVELHFWHILRESLLYRV